MSHEEEQELLTLTRDNNRMLREIISYINLKDSQADSENLNDFLRNILANIISTNIDLRNFVK
jgi:hypothetical protein